MREVTDNVKCITNRAKKLVYTAKTVAEIWSGIDVLHPRWCGVGVVAVWVIVGATHTSSPSLPWSLRT